MLDKPIDEIVLSADGKFEGVRSGEETVKAKLVIGSPDYFGAGKAEGDGGKVRVLEESKVVRAICLLKHNIPGTEESDSVQIIIPQNQVNRRNGGSSLLLELAARVTSFLTSSGRHLHRFCLGRA